MEGGGRPPIVLFQVVAHGAFEEPDVVQPRQGRYRQGCLSYCLGNISGRNGPTVSPTTIGVTVIYRRGKGAK